jgi:hypothetical protein
MDGVLMSEQSRVARRDAIKKSLDQYRDDGNLRTETIDFRGAKKSLEVITLLPSSLLLNHDNSRLSAQLEDHIHRHIVETDPTSEKAQEVLTTLLRSTDQFKNLKEELKVLGQKNPGIVSRDGVLINGNTRLVALRDLGATGIDVAVLPEDALAEDFLDIEMSLQMTALTHQDYTFTNQLLLMRRYLERDHSPKELATKMGWVRNWQKKVDQYDRILRTINEIRNLYAGNFPYEFFDAKQQVFKDLDDEYQRLVTTDFDAAEKLKWARITAILLGVSKDQVRAMDEDFFEDEVIKRLDTKPEVSTLFKKHQSSSNPSLDEILGDSTEQTDMKSFAKSLINDMVSVDGQIIPDLDEKYQEIATQVKLGADEIITAQKLQNYLAEPHDVLRETRINLDKILENFGEISGMSGFKSGDFDYELKKVLKAVQDLVVKSKKYLEK